jgi:tetratricopeptide (TPR) repeat protein
MRKRRGIFLGLILAAGVVLAALALTGRGGDKRLARDRVAVAVFTNRTGDTTLEPLGSMAADWVTRGLGQSGLVDVVDIAAVYAEGRGETGDPTDPVLLARRNGAGTVVSGSYYLATDSLVLRATLVDAASGTVLQTVPPVHAPAGDAVRALDQLRQHVTTAVAGVLDVRYTSFTAGPSPPRSFAAYEAFIAGQAAYWRGGAAPEVRALFQRAVAEDSTFLTAAVWLAFVGANGGGCALTDSMARALAPRRAALQPFDRLTLDISEARCRSDWKGGYRLAREQAGLRPRSTYAVYTAGVFGLFSGHFHGARDLLGGIDPERDLGWLSDSAKTIYWRDYTGALHFTGDYRTELEHAEQLVRRFPTRTSLRYFAGRSLGALGRGDDALSQLASALRLRPDAAARVHDGFSPGHMAALLAMELRSHGDSAASREAASRCVEWYREAPDERLGGRYERYYLARCLLLLSRTDEALAAVALRAAEYGKDPLYRGLEGVLAAMQGARLDAERAEQELAAVVQPALVAVATTQRARIATALGQRERALQLLAAAIDQGVPRVPTGMDMHLEPIYEPLRGDTLFERLERGQD